MKRYRYIVRGRVQGVGFRYFCKDEAERRNLTGFARNLPNGTVEVEAQGDDTVLETFERSLQQGPRRAEVTELTREERGIDLHEMEFLIG